MDRQVFPTQVASRVFRPRRRLATVAAYVALVLFAQACSMKSFGTGGVSDGTPRIPKAKAQGAIAFLPNCPIETLGATTEAIPLVGLALGWVVTTLGPIAVDAVVGSIGTFLEERANALNASTTASSRVQLWTKDERTVRLAAQCLVFIRGEFGPGEPSTDHGFSTVKDRTVWDQASTGKVNELLQRSKSTLRLRGVPEVYIELPIRYPTVEVSVPATKDAGGNVVRPTEIIKIPQSMDLGPPLVVYTRPGPERFDRSKKLILEVTLTADLMLDKKRQLVTLLDRPIDLGEIALGTRVPSDTFVAAPAVRVAVPYPFEEEFHVFRGDKLVPVTALNLVTLAVTASLTETEQGGDLERAIAKAARENKSKLNEPVVKFLQDLVKKITGEEETSKDKEAKK